MACPPCAFSNVQIPCLECNRFFRSDTCFANLKHIINRNVPCTNEYDVTRRVERAVTRGNHECNKRYCDNSTENKKIGHMCYMRPLKDALSPASDKVLYAFYDFVTTQNSEYTAEAKLHVPNIVCVQQFCARCEDVEEGDCVRCCKRKHSLWQDPVGELLTYVTEPRPWTNKIVATAHNAKAFDLHFILNRAILVKWKSEIIMKRLKIMCMKVEI